MQVVDLWTGWRANALRLALRMTNESFASNLGVAVRTVAKWNADPDLVPPSEFQRMLDTRLAQASEEEKARFALLMNQGATDVFVPMPRADQDGGGIDLRLAHDSTFNDALHWLDSHTGSTDGSAKKRVKAELRRFNLDSVEAQAHRRGRITRDMTAKALAEYYGSSLEPNYSFYHVRTGRTKQATSIVAQNSWLNLKIPLGEGKDRFVLVADKLTPNGQLSAVATAAAFRRLAEILATSTRMVNSPLYRLVGLDINSNGLHGKLGLTTFIDYALTLDLLENELVDALVHNMPIRRGALPLRDDYLNDGSALANVADRICAGGPLALLAIARSSRSRKGNPPDYVLLIQERSGNVLNATRRLAVIPKAFHQPLVDFTDDTRLSATIEREMEEELFGRPEVDSTRGQQRLADPMHVSSLSEPMRWLTTNADPATWHIECVGFGINAMTGNFEFPCLIVIDDETWWDRFGGAIQANWETEGLRRYSSLDRELVTDLINDPAWSNEGLFAFLQALRRLNQIGGERTDLPPIELDT